MLKSIFSFTDERRELTLTFLIFIVLAYCIFANTFTNGWTMDDLPAIINNPDIQSFNDFLANTYPGRPLREITFMLDHVFFGLNPMGYHIQQIFWHSLNAFLIFVLIRRLTGNRIVSWISSLLFLVHPIQVEVVASISHRKESLLLAFSLFSIFGYVKSFDVNRNRAFWVAGSFSLAIIAYLAKETAVILPFIFLAYELTFVDRKERLLLRYPLITLLVLATGIVIALVWLGYIGGLENVKNKMHLSLIVHANHFTHSEFSTWYAMILKSWVFMLSKTFLPLDLAVEYVYPVPESWLDSWVLSAILIVILYILSLYLSFRRQSVIFFSLFWLAAFFLPASNLLPLSYLAADRYLYAPSVGLFILAGLFLYRSYSRFRLATVAVLLILILTLAALTWKQNKIWNSTFTLYANAVRVSPRAAFALNNLGWEYYMRSDLTRSLYLLQKSTKVNPYLPMPLYSLASIYERIGDRKRALYYYSKSLSVSHYMPGFFDPIAKSIKEKLRKKYGVTNY
jgi:tetratricopeptide (TPR) repeat protein